MNTSTPAQTKYKCPKCHMKESEDRHLTRIGRNSVKVHLCWFCEVKGQQVEMEKVK